MTSTIFDEDGDPPPSAADIHPLSDILERLAEPGEADGDFITFEQILEAFGQRAFGPVLLFPALLSIIPIIGALPGVSITTALMTLVISLQMVLGLGRPWLPHRLLSLTVKREQLAEAARRTRPLALRLERWTRPRLQFLAREPWLRVVSLVAFALSIGMCFGALVPGGVVPPAVAIIILALGLTTFDGLLIAISGALAAGAIGLLYWFFF